MFSAHVFKFISIRNLSISLAAGNATLWKPSPTTPLCSIATTKIVSSVLEKNGLPGAVAGLVLGGKDIGEAVVESKDVDMGISSRISPPKCYADYPRQFPSPGVRPSGVRLVK